MRLFITKYIEEEKCYAEAWLQVNFLGRSFCFFRKRIEI